MKKLADFLINRRRVLTAVMLVLTAVCAVLALRVPINRDRTKYLADSSEMKQGLSIMEDVFPESDETASIRVMFDDLTADQIPEIKAQLEAIPNVSGVVYEAGSEEYNKDNHTLFVVNSGTITTPTRSTRSKPLSKRASPAIRWRMRITTSRQRSFRSGLSFLR